MSRSEWGNGYVQVPGWFLKRMPTPNELTVYVHLGMFGTFRQGEGVYDECRPSVPTLANGDPKRKYPGTGLSESTVRRALAGLVEKGAATAISRVDPDTGARLPNVYRLQFGYLAPPLVTDDQGDDQDTGPLVTDDQDPPVTGDQGAGVTDDQDPPVTGDQQPITTTPSTRHPDPDTENPPPPSTSHPAGEALSAAAAGTALIDDARDVLRRATHDVDVNRMPTGPERARLIERVLTLFSAGWQPDQLAARLLGMGTLATVASVYAVLTSRLGNAGAPPPPAPAVNPVGGPVSPWCGASHCDRTTRVLLDDDDRPLYENVDGARRPLWCPDCSGR